MEYVTIETEYKNNQGEKFSRNVTLSLNRDKSISLLGGLTHGTKVIINQKLIDDLQKLLNEIQKES